MLINDDTLIGLRVETQNGRVLGKISGLIIETDAQSVHQYYTKPEGISAMFSRELLISREQVISISEKKMVVEDGAVKSDPADHKKRQPASAIETGVITQEN